MSEIITKINSEIRKYEELKEQYNTYAQECEIYIEDLKVSRTIISDLSRNERPKTTKTNSKVWTENSTFRDKVRQALKDLGEANTAQIKKYIDQKMNWSVDSSLVSTCLGQLYKMGEMVARRKENNVNFYKLNK